MSAPGCVLNIRYVPVSAGAGRSAARLSHYLQHRDGDRAFYQMVISPADGRGVDLPQLTRATMERVRNDCGPVRWIAAEHRNTKHPHVHVVMAARRQREGGGYKTLIINRQRLERMKGAMTLDLGASTSAPVSCASLEVPSSSTRWSSPGATPCRQRRYRAQSKAVGSRPRSRWSASRTDQPADWVGVWE